MFIVIQLIKTFPTIMQSEGSISSSENPCTGAHPEPVQSIPHFLTLFL